MFQKLDLKTKLIAIVAPPLIVLAIIALYGLLLSMQGAGADLADDVKMLGIVALAAWVITAGAAVTIGRTITSPVSEATEAAREIADVRLPGMLEALANGTADSTTFTPISTESSGDLKGLIDALNDVQTSAVDVAKEQQELVRKGLSDLVVNMARRNQTLLDRQIEYIDRLESNEENPDRLEELYGLDHLATRMRRNAESLLVLAGAETSRRRGGPVAIGDVLRVAMSEIEDYRHVQMVNIEEAEIGSQSAVDLAHLLSELMENATQFSPPDSPVEINGTAHPDGTYFITVVDHGIGMSAEQLNSSNSILKSPPELGLNLSRSLGFIVIGRLAKRLAIEVELAHTSNGGITAILAVPSTVLSSGDTPLARSATATIDAGLPAAPAPLAQAPIAPVAAPAPAPSPAASSPFTEPEEPWSPPVMPERSATAFGATPEASPFGDSTEPAIPAALAPAPSATPAPAPAQAPASAAGTSQSDALSRLLGLDPSTVDSSPSAEPVQPADPKPFNPEDLFSRPAPAPVEESKDFVASTNWEAPSFEPAPFNLGGQGETVPAGDAPGKLEEAIPSGDSFDQGVDSLLEADSRTSTGLAKRDRSTSKAPVSEGRRTTASVRSPDEIRSMLARYRDGLKGKPLEGMADETSGTDGQDPFSAPVPPSPNQSNPFGESA